MLNITEFYQTHPFGFALVIILISTSLYFFIKSFYSKDENEIEENTQNNAKPAVVTVWECSECGEEYDTKQEADNCCNIIAYYNNEKYAVIDAEDYDSNAEMFEDIEKLENKGYSVLFTINCCVHFKKK